MENKIKIGEKIRLLRKKNDVTQDKLADHLGVTPQAVSRWESGVCYPDMNYLPAIADYFSVTMDELLCYNNAQKEQKVAAYLEEADRLLIREEQSSLLRLAIGSLPDKYRTVLMLSVVEEMDTDEISALLHITPSSVRCQLSRAKQQLIKWYRK